MKKAVALALSLALTPLPVFAAPSPAERVAGRTLDAISADGTSLLLRAPGQRLDDAGADLSALLGERLPEELHAILTPARGLAIRHAGQETPLGLPDDSYFAPLTARLSADGRVLAVSAGHGGALKALRVRVGEAPTQLVPDAQARYSGVSGVSDDGRVVAGWLLKDTHSLPKGFVWREGAGLTVLPVPLSLPRAISADGRVLAGTAYIGSPGQLRQASLIGQFAAEDPLGGNAAIADWALVGASDDGRRLAGFVKRADKKLWQGFLWDRDAGFIDTPTPPVFDVARGAPPQADVERAVLANYGLTDADRIGALRRQAWRWADGKAEVLQDQATLAGMSRDGQVFIVRTADGALLQMPGAAGQPLAFPGAQGALEVRAVSSDGRRIWLRDEAGASAMLDNGKAAPASRTAAFAQPAAFSADARTVAGIYLHDPAGVRPALRWQGDRVDARECRFGGASAGLVFLSADGGTLAASQPDGYCVFGGF
ncbi:hypothetical protein [Crenobacter caeni]|uniref:Uncharacterized protein n=1 Tax=Crenobacter caeni TaxID=2705474 RepID=A0A6B2KTY6_9NEIS|nr:hypothetical protein [Crenobacter caeni]NDV13705.1 hypothetical protein [Crenobacter caeni]